MLNNLGYTHTHTRARARARTHAHTLPLCLSEYVILFSHGNSGYANATKYYVIGTLPVLFSVKPGVT
jgi:hypothetical protein